jgi:hypothetical protein
MKVLQGNSQCSYLKQPKMSFFLSSSFLIQNHRTGRWSRFYLVREVLVPVGREKRWRNGEGG